MFALGSGAPDPRPISFEKLSSADDHGRAVFTIKYFDLIGRPDAPPFGRDVCNYLARLGLVDIDQFSATPRRTEKKYGEVKKLLVALDPFSQIVAIRILDHVSSVRGTEVVGTAILHMNTLVQFFDGRPDQKSLHIRKLFLRLLEDEMFPGVESVNLAEFLGRRLHIIRVDDYSLKYLSATDVSAATEALDYLRRIGKHGDVPHLDGPVGSPEKTLRDGIRVAAQSIVKRVWTLSADFDRYSAESRRPTKTSKCMMHRYGEACFNDFRLVHGKNVDQAPGRGFFYSRPRVETQFWGGEDWYATNREAYSSLRDALRRYPKFTFVALRGCFIAFHPDSAFELPVGDLAEGRTEHMCLYVTNNHQTGGLKRGALLPSRIVRRKVFPSTYSPGSDKYPADITNPGFTLESLVGECKREKLPALELANISTLFSGMSAAYPYNSDPYHGWEARRDTENWRDAMGRVHYSWRVREVSDTDAREELLSPLLEADARVTAAARGYLDLIALFFNRYEAWKANMTPGLEEAPRMLIHAYEWYKSTRDTRGIVAPVLCRFHRYNRTIPPLQLLRTGNLTIRAGDGSWIELPRTSDGQGATELTLWKKYVASQVSQGPPEAISENEWALGFIMPEYLK